MKTKHIKAYMRAATATLALLTMVVGTTLAAANTQAALMGTSLSTTSADLLIYDGQGFSDSAPGFVVQNLVPGVGSAEYRLAFQNTGGKAIGIGAHVPTAYTFDGFNSTSATTAMKTVKVVIKNLHDGTETTTTLYSLGLTTDVPLPGAPLGAGVAADPASSTSEGNYSIRFDVDPTAIGTSKATVDPFDIVFTGKAVAS